MASLPKAAPVHSVLAKWLSNPKVSANIVDAREVPSRPARHVDIPQWLEPRLISALWDRGVTRLYSHQAEALDALRQGKDIVVATPTASGKSLCYHLPVLDALLKDPSARALYLFPTKALSRDQLESVRELVTACRAKDSGVVVYDGDTPPDHRRAARTKARIVATNPDMLHAGILPHHASWGAFFAGLTHVVVDELHVYRGVFGSGVANVMRRLRRIAQFHGSQPQFIATSATIANPGELGAKVLGTDESKLHVILESGAPAGPKTLVLYNPPIIDSALGIRASYLKTAKRIARDLIDAQVGTLVFARSRRAVEILVRYLRDDLDNDGPVDLDTEEAIRGYRGGYLPNRRREVEKLLREGQTSCVVATSALELGIDVGGLDAVVVAGWPGSRAAAWQRIGRAGRRGAPSLAVVVCCSEPLDQYVAADPEYLFGEPPEHGRVDPDNLAVLVPHVKCAAFELPFAKGEGFGPLGEGETCEVLGHLVRKGLLHEDRNTGGFHWIADAYPAQGVSLRGISDENFAVIDLPSGQVLAEVDYRDAARQIHPNAIYPLEAKLFQVERLDWGAHKAFVREVDVDYTTDALTNTKVRVLDVREESGCAGQGEVHVVEKVVGFKKIKLHTHENVGYGDVALPPFEIHTRAVWLDVPIAGPPGSSTHGEALVAWQDGLRRAAYALHHMAALAVLCDPADLSHDIGDTGRIFLYDNMPGGIGLAERLYDERTSLVGRAFKLVSACKCERGCPGCVGAIRDTTGNAKRAAIEVLSFLGKALGSFEKEGQS
ncbi:MAG: DEAD/DEAH box helicase [Deltaproteobacteria bacterium]|nr:DEAD/DEAH box helicase [Deltaproteobacteria bacterium]